MSELEMTVKALTRCVSPQAFALAMQEVRAEAQGNEEPCERFDASEMMIRRILKELGIPSRILGHSYLVSALELMVEEPSLLYVITKQLYPRVAETHNTTASRVERAIRHAIEIAWDRGGLDVQYKYFGNSVKAEKGKPTNSEFLSVVADVVRQKLKHS